MTTQTTTNSRTDVVRAWAVHIFTMLSVPLSMLALVAFVHDQIKMVWLWLAIAMMVDAVDGTFARRARVSEVVPWFDGMILDDIVDYITWTFIPALVMYEYLPWGNDALSLIAAIIAASSSMWCYCNKGMKSKDYFFVGFPAAWNIVALYLWLLHTPAWFNWIILVIFVALTVLPVTFLHPFRVRKAMVPNIAAALGWVGIAAALVMLYPAYPLWLVVLWFVPGLWFVGVSAWRTWRGVDPAEVVPAHAC